MLGEVTLCYFDDFVWGGTPEFENKIIGELKKTVSVSSQECETFTYRRPYVEQNDGVISAHQIHQ